MMGSKYDFGTFTSLTTWCKLIITQQFSQLSHDSAVPANSLLQLENLEFALSIVSAVVLDMTQPSSIRLG